MTEISFFSFSTKIEYFKLFFRIFLPEKKFRIWISILENQFFKFLTGKNPKISNLINQFLDYQMILIQFFYLDHKHFINECFEVWRGGQNVKSIFRMIRTSKDQNVKNQNVEKNVESLKMTFDVLIFLTP